jgi:hypothetical protein
MNGFCGDAEHFCQFLDVIYPFLLPGDRAGKAAAQLRDENPQVIRKVGSFYQLLLGLSLGVVTRNAETHEVERILFLHVDEHQKLFGGIELFLPMLLGHESKLYQQLSKVLILYLPHKTFVLML